MMHLLAGLLLISGQAASEAPRDWSSIDPLVRFASDSRMETPRPRGAWTGRASITVSCVVTEPGAFEDCQVVAETPPGRINARTAVRAFRHARLDLGGADGPRPGDTVTTELLLSRARIPR